MLSMQHLRALMVLQTLGTAMSIQLTPMESIQLDTEDKNTVKHNQCCQPW